MVIHNSQFIRSISCISSYMFRFVYRAIFRLVFRVFCMYNVQGQPEDGSEYEPKHVARNTTNPFIQQSVLRQVQNLFQSELSTQCDLELPLQMRVSSTFLKVIQQLPTSSSSSSCHFYPPIYLSFNNPLQKAVSTQNVTNPVRLPFTVFVYVFFLFGNSLFGAQGISRPEQWMGYRHVA